jgi:hypothetical protein
MRTILFIITFLTFISCRQKENSDNTLGKYNLYAIATNEDSTGLITSPCAVMIWPTIAQIESLKQPDSTGFYVAADDNQYYMAISREYLDSLKTKIVEKESKGSLLFKTKSGQYFEMKLDSLYWGIILFNGKTKPIKINETSIESEYKIYMKK